MTAQATPEQLEMARRIVKSCYPDTDMNCAGDLLRVALTAILAADQQQAELLRAVEVLRNGYADAAAGLAYVRERHGALDGVGFDRVADHFFKWVTMPEREGLLAGSHKISRDFTLTTKKGN